MKTFQEWLNLKETTTLQQTCPNCGINFMYQPDNVRAGNRLMCPKCGHISIIQNQNTQQQNTPNQQHTETQLQNRFIRKALTDLEQLSQMSNDNQAASMLNKIKSQVLDGSLNPNLQKALIDAYKNNNLNIFKQAYSISRKIN